MKSKTDLYDSKFDLGQLSLDLSESSSSNSVHDYTNFNNATRFALLFQPLFAVCWFIGVLALENVQSYIFPTVFAISYNILVFLEISNKACLINEIFLELVTLTEITQHPSIHETFLRDRTSRSGGE